MAGTQLASLIFLCIGISSGLYAIFVGLNLWLNYRRCVICRRFVRARRWRKILNTKDKRVGYCHDCEEEGDKGWTD